jgi:hypothetical protein
MIATRDQSTGLDSDFIALICADEELLRAEFEEIVAAGLESGPPSRPRPEHDHRPDRSSAREPAPTPEAASPGTAPSEDRHEWPRQRSPPPHLSIPRTTAARPA